MTHVSLTQNRPSGIAPPDRTDRTACVGAPCWDNFATVLMIKSGQMREQGSCKICCLSAATPHTERTYFDFPPKIHHRLA